MEIYFNELCLKSLNNIQYNDISRMSALYLRLKDHGINTCRIAPEAFSELIKAVSSMPGTSPDLRNFLYAFMRYPYESEAVEKKQDLYLMHEWKYNGTDCFGLALAYIMESMALSFFEEEWDKLFIKIESDQQPVQVRNLYGDKVPEEHRIWLESLKLIELKVCDIPLEEKKLKLRDKLVPVTVKKIFQILQICCSRHRLTETR